MNSESVNALYGYSSELPLLKDKTIDDQLEFLRSLGVNALFGGYEKPELVEKAHSKGMKIYAELSCFVGQEWWEKYPSSRPVTAKGEKLQCEGWYCGVNPSVPAVRKELLGQLKDLLKKPVDGVWLDFIRWPCHWEDPHPCLPRTSFDRGTLDRFSQESGLDLDLPEERERAADRILKDHRSRWIAWRCGVIESWVAQARRLRDRLRPRLTLGLFGVPWRPEDHGEAIREIIGQDYGALSQSVDVFSPMAYHLMVGRKPDWVGKVVDKTREMTGRPVWPVVQSVDQPRTLAPSQYGQVLRVAKESGGRDGLIVFTAEGVLEDRDKLEETKRIFAQD